MDGGTTVASSNATILADTLDLEGILKVSESKNNSGRGKDPKSVETQTIFSREPPKRIGNTTTDRL
jgi:hypothetical protein